MNKTKLNYLIDFFAFLSFVLTAVSGLFIFFFMPEGVRQGRFQEFMGIQKGVWTDLHNWAGILMIIFVAVHFLLHWDWIVCVTKNMFKSEQCDKK